MEISDASKQLIKLIDAGLLSKDVVDAIEIVLSEATNANPKEPSPHQRAKSFKRWTKEEESKLIGSFLEGKTLDRIAKDHERSCNAIFQRLLLVGIVSLSQPVDFTGASKSEKPKVPLISKEVQAGRICTSCGDRIDPLRLSVQPNTYRCLVCQQNFEKRSGLNMSEKFR